MKIAVIIPVYNEADAIESNFAEIRSQLDADGLDAVYILVDDGSKDCTWNKLHEITQKYSSVKAIKFSRNFGKEMAIRAGLDNIKADYYAVIDSDLQHPPRHVKKMLDLAISKKLDIVNGKKASRGKENTAYKFFAGGFYGLMHTLTGVSFRGTSDFKIISDKVAEEIRKFKERDGLFRGFIDWVGFENADYYFDVEPRKAGTTSFSPRKLFRLAFSAIVGHSSKPLMLTMYISAIFFIFAIFLGIQTLVNYFSGNAISGFSTVILLQLLIGSCTLFCLGLIGIYLARIYEEIKQRPPYILTDSKTSENISGK